MHMLSLVDVRILSASQLSLGTVARVPRSGCYGDTAYDRCHRILKISLKAVQDVSVCICQDWWTCEYQAPHNEA